MACFIKVPNLASGQSNGEIIFNHQAAKTLVPWTHDASIGHRYLVHKTYHIKTIDWTFNATHIRLHIQCTVFFTLRHSKGVIFVDVHVCNPFHQRWWKAAVTTFAQVLHLSTI